jgi:hypothetical protein
MKGDGASCKVGLKQPPLQDVEPPGGVARRVVSWAFTEMAAFGA